MVKLLILFSLILIIALTGCTTIKETSEPGTLPPERIYPEGEEPLFPMPDIIITRWAGNARAACSLTFDDGTLDHYLAAYPIMEEYGVKGTFFLFTHMREKGSWYDYNSERFLMTWDQAMEISRNGHELGSHSLTHLDLRALAGREDEEDILDKEIADSVEEIEKRTGAVVTTFAWPYRRFSTNGKGKVMNNFIAAREGTISPLKLMDISDEDIVSPPDPGAIPSYAIMPNQTRKEWEDIGKNTISRGGWLPLCLHGIDNPDIPREALGWEPIPEKDFRTILDYLSDQSVWTAPFGTVFQYIRQRDRAKVEIDVFTHRRMVIDLSFPMKYTAPLVPVTLEITLPFTWNGRIYSSDGTVVILQRDETNILAELIPHPHSEKGRISLGF